LAVRCPTCHSDNPDTVRFCGECGTKLDASTPGHPPASADRASFTKTLETTKDQLIRGTLFAGRYEIIEELGAGGMGRVYRAHDNKLNEEVALKLIKSEIAADKRTVERFRNELKTARKIRHKNVCGMYDFHEDGKTLYLTMEYVRGEDLNSLIRRTERLTPGKAVSIARQLGEGLSEAHKLGIIHRDLKPGNVMIDKDGNAKIMDFGIARSLAGGGTTADGAIVGTPEYMSPEQVDGKEADQRSDIYALGIVLFEMVTGRLPFEGETPFSVANKQKSEPPPDLRKINPQIPAELDRVILRSLEKAKEKRYQTTGEFLADLATVEESLPKGERISTQPRAGTSREITVKFRLKKLLIPGLLTVALVATAVIIIWRLIPQKAVSPAKSAKHSIAVLPFEDLSPEKKYEYLCEGIPDTLIQALTRVKDLRVPARLSAFSFKGKSLEIGEIAKTLNVETVLRGSVQVIGDRLRVTPQLIDANSGSYIWSDLFDRKIEDIFAIQDEIAQEVVKALKIKLLGDEERSLIKNSTSNLEAYNLYLQGRYFWNKRTTEDIKRAVDYFSRAVENDPRYAPAYVGLADCYLMLVFYGGLPQKEYTAKAMSAVSKALEIDEQMPEAYASLAKIKEWSAWDWKGAEQDYRRSIELNPNYATAHHWYAISLTIVGRLDEAMVETRKAIEIDPLSPVIKSTLGDELYFKGEYDRAIEQYLSTLELSKDFAEAHTWLAKCYRQKGMLGQAVSEFEIAAALDGQSSRVLGGLANAYATAGNVTKAREILATVLERSKRGLAVDSHVALIYWGLREKERTLDALERAYQQGEIDVSYLKVEPAWQSLRSDDRIRALLRKMNLE
jgi:eukaryotic-like serine/threonine-protein kinase